MEQVFQVDLRGIVDLLSHHLYSSPRVYLRELLQNAVDAITARRALDSDAPAAVRVETPQTTNDGTLRVHDTGIGLTESEVHEFLATIGRSGKRDDLGFARHEFLGQFGIGLLSCFLISDQARVLTRSARGGPTVEWTGYADGRYRVTVAAEERAEPGTTVILSPREGMQPWASAATVKDLATFFGGLLPFEVAVDGQPTTAGELPWRRHYATPNDRLDALSSYAAETFGFTPLAIFDLAGAESGLNGVAFVLPEPANPTAKAGNRVYLKRMLLGDSVTGLLPEWAFFVRCVVDTSELRPTANREALYEDDLLDCTRVELGNQIRDWLVALSSEDPAGLARFLQIHHLGVKALALHDDDMLRLVDRWLPVETNAGEITLAEFRRRFGTVRHTNTVEEFRQLAAVCNSHGLGVVNGGYTYITAIVQRLPEIDPSIRVSRLEASELATHFDVLDSATELALRPFLVSARRALDRVDCDVALRAYDPPSLPALYVFDREARHRAELHAAQDVSDDLWSEVLDVFAGSDQTDRPQLLLNYRNPLVRKVTSVNEPQLAATGVEALYCQALLMGQHPLRPVDSALLNRSFAGLLGWAVHGGEDPRGDERR